MRSSAASPMRSLTRAEQFGPETLVAWRVGAAQANVAEARDAGVARSEVACAAVVRAHDQVDAVAAGVVKIHERTHVTLFALRRAAVAHRDPGVAELRRGRVKQLGAAQLEAHVVVSGVGLEVDQGVVTRVAAAVARALLLPHALQADQVARKAVRRAQVARAQAPIPNVQQVDHRLCPRPVNSQQAPTVARGSPWHREQRRGASRAEPTRRRHLLCLHRCRVLTDAPCKPRSAWRLTFPPPT